MYEHAFKLEVITPTKVVFQGDATSLTAPGVQGGFQILYNHAPLLSVLDVGEIKVKDKEGKDTRYATSGGFVQVKDNTVVVLVETAEQPHEIDVKRAKAAVGRAEQRLHAGDPRIDVDRARAALMRALNRLRIAERA